MTVLSLASWVFDRHQGTLPRSLDRDRGADSALRRLLDGAAPAGAAFAMLAAAAGTAFGDRPTVFNVLALVAAVAMVPLLFRGLASRVEARLDAAVAERDILQAELDTGGRAEEKLRNLAYHDDLTGLPNRGLLHDRLGLAIAHSLREASHLAVLFLDLDDFKSVNDSLGHGPGDRLLVELASRIRGSVRAADTVARFGGDEFVVLLDTVTGAEDAARVAAKVLDAVRAPFRIDGDEVAIAASIGVSVYPRDGTSAEELVRSADVAMYRDKHREKVNRDEEALVLAVRSRPHDDQRAAPGLPALWPAGDAAAARPRGRLGRGDSGRRRASGLASSVPRYHGVRASTGAALTSTLETRMHD